MAEQDFVMVSHSDAHPPMSQEETQKILEWLAPTEYSAEGSEYQKHVQAHVPGTGNWIFGTDQYRKWSESSDVGTLWIKGVPGSGKSMVAADLIKTLSEKLEKVPVLYFFFRNIIKKNSKPESVIRDFLAQLLPYSSQLGSSLRRLMVRYSDVEAVSISVLWDNFIASLSNITHALVVVDALDEIEEGKEEFATDMLLELGHLKPQSIKLVVTSRPLPIYQKPSENPKTSILKLLGKVVDQDISLYVSHRLDNQLQRAVSPEERDTIKMHLCDGQQPGLFLQARLMLDELLRSQDPIEELLSHSLQSMSQIYEKILQEHSLRSGISQDVQVHVLEWITHASRPPRVLELAELFLTQGTFPDIQKAKSALKICCGPLLEVLDNETLSVIHHSFTEFLLDTTRIAAQSTEAFPVLSSPEVHTKLAYESIDYLLYAFAASDAKKTTWWGEQSKKEHMIRFPFLQYAVQNWPYHVTKSVETQELLQKSMIFTRLDILLKSKSQELDSLLHFFSAEQRSTVLECEAIHIASHLGLTKYVGYLLQTGLKPNVPSPDGRTPMMFAASQGHTDILRILVTDGGDIEKTDCLGLTALHHAAMKNQGDAVHVLVECGGDLMCSKVNDEQSKLINRNYYNPFPRRQLKRRSSLYGTNPGEDSLLGYTPIKFACDYGCSSAVKALMHYMNTDQRVTVDLNMVAYRGYSEVLSILLQYPEVSNMINKADDTGNTPLILASRDIDPEMVRILLKAGASTAPVFSSVKEQVSYVSLGQKRRRTQTNVGKTPLNAWAEVSHNMTPRDEASLLSDMEKVAEMLIAAGCDVDVRSAEGFTPLFLWNDKFSRAAVSKKFVSILLHHGADPKAIANCGSTPIHMMRGREEEKDAVLLLIKAGADINAVKSSDGRTPLLNMAFNTHDVPDVKPFIEYGVDFNVCDKEGNFVLHYLMKKSIFKHQVEDWLQVCDPKLLNKLGETCMFALCHRWPAWGLEKVVNEAKGHGLDLEIKNIFGRTALMEACCEGGNDHIKYFLAAGADAGVRDSRGRTCLHLLLAAQSDNLSARSRSSKDFQEIVKQLISAGVDPMANDFSGNHLIHSAIWSEKSFMNRTDALEPIKTAIKFGGDPKSRNHAGQNALHLAAARILDSSIEAKNIDTTRMTLLLDSNVGMSLLAKDQDGLTPTHVAAGASEAILCQMISAGAHIRAKDFRDRTPLHFAAGSLSNTTGVLCEIYSRNSWNVDEKDIKGRTPLHEAACTGNYEAVKFLLESGADPLLIDGLQKSPLHLAAAFHRTGVVDSMEKEFYQSGHTHAQRTAKPLYIGNSKILQRPLGLWLNDERDQRNAYDVVRVLLDTGADPHLVDYLGRTAYDIALLNNNESVADLLAVSNPIAINESAITKFPDVLSKRWLSSNSRSISEIVRSLPTKEAEQDRYLESAIYLGSNILLKTLLNLGLDPRKATEGDDGFTIVHAVVCTGQISTMKTLSSHIGDVNTFHPPLLHLAVERQGSNLEMLKLLLELGADPNAWFPKLDEVRDRNKKSQNEKFPVIEECHTVLHRLATGLCWWYPKAITILADSGADIDAMNSKGMTALHFAISSSNHGFWRDQCLDKLLSHGADVNKVCEKSGLTPLNMALEGGGGIKMVKKLLKHNADIGAGPNPPLISAIKGADLKGTKLLLDAGADPNGLYGSENRRPLQIAADAWSEDGAGCDGP